MFWIRYSRGSALENKILKNLFLAGLLSAAFAVSASARGRQPPSTQFVLDPASVSAAPLAELYFDRLVQPLSVFSPSLAALASLERQRCAEAYAGLSLRDLSQPGAPDSPALDPP